MSDLRHTKMELNELHSMVGAWNDTLSDDTVPSDYLTFHSPFGLRYAPEQGAHGGGLFAKVDGVVEQTTSMTEDAFQQLCERFLVRSDWARDDRKCPPELRAMIFDWKFSNFERAGLMIRNRITNGERVTRAVLSDQYTRYDHFEFVDALRAALTQAGLSDKVTVWRPEVGDTMRAYILIDQIEFDAPEAHDPTQGDGGGAGGLKPAVYISNSETGTGKARVTGGLYRSVCSNGLLLGYRERDAFAVTHRWKTAKHMTLMMNEAIATALNMSEQAGNAFLNARAEIIQPTKLDGIITKWATKYGVTLSARKAWRVLCQTELDREGRISKFDLINHATDSAGSIENGAVREAMEAMAGGLLFAELPTVGRSR